MIMDNLMCSTCMCRYGCGEKREHDCKKNDYKWREEDHSVHVPCFGCSGLNKCFINFESSKEHSEFCVDCITHGYNKFLRDSEKVTEEYDYEEGDTASIEWVSREKRIGDVKCPKCGEVITFGVTIIQKVPYCSSCGKRLDDRFMNYCPNCGKKIRK